MTTANKITIVRVLLVPFFIVQVIYYIQTEDELYRFLALLAFAVAAVSDGLDGYIARRYQQRSELGAILDPLADKLLLVSGIVLLSLHNTPKLPAVPIWMTATVLSRDVLLTIGLAVIHFVAGKVAVQPRWTGKLATVFQMTVVLWALFKWDAQWLFYWCLGATAFTGISGVQYVFDGISQLSAHPASSPSPPETAEPTPPPS